MRMAVTGSRARLPGWLPVIVIFAIGCVDQTDRPATSSVIKKSDSDAPPRTSAVAPSSTDSTDAPREDTDSTTETGDDADTGLVTGDVAFPVVFSFDDGMDNFYSGDDGWSHNPEDGTIELDHTFTEPGNMVWMENNIAAVTWQGADWSGATIIEFRVKTIEASSGYYLPYIQSGDWLWYSDSYGHDDIGEWRTLRLDMEQGDENVDVSRVLRLGLQVHAPFLTLDGGVSTDPDASLPTYPEPERVRIAVDSIVVHGPDYIPPK